MSKHKRKHANRQKPQMYGHNGNLIITEDFGDSNVIEIAHMLLDDYINGAVIINGSDDVQWLNRLESTLVHAREFYKNHKDILQVNKAHYQSDHAGKRPEPHTTPATAATVTMENRRGEQVPAIPLPLFGLKKQCSCGQSFWKLHNYETHYAHEHIVLGRQPL